MEVSAEDINLAVNEVFEEKKSMILEQRYRTNGLFIFIFLKIFLGSFRLNMLMVENCFSAIVSSVLNIVGVMPQKKI